MHVAHLSARSQANVKLVCPRPVRSGPRIEEVEGLHVKSRLELHYCRDTWVLYYTFGSFSTPSGEEEVRPLRGLSAKHLRMRCIAMQKALAVCKWRDASDSAARTTGYKCQMNVEGKNKHRLRLTAEPQIVLKIPSWGIHANYAAKGQACFILSAVAPPQRFSTS